MTTRFSLGLACFFLPAAADALAQQRADILVADFEGDDYGEWKVEGEAFGPGPAKGTLPGQMEVSGYLGERLVNSFFGGDRTTGKLASPPLQIERKYFNFLIGGGMHPGETCMNLLIDGRVVRTAAGPNDRPGGSERLDWHTWDVSEFEGRTAVLEIVDRHTGGWGHINVDHIVQSDRRMQAEPASRELLVERRYLHLPVKNGAPSRRMKFVLEGQPVREFDIELADGPPDLFVFADMTPFQGRTLQIEVDRLPADSQALAAIVAGDDVPGGGQLYREKHRPQFHFTSRRGWLNDPNGLVWFKGEWHLYYQHNPYGIPWGNMHWGHAVSRDLVHWRELPIALYPPRHGDWCFSGSAVVDEQNTSGFQAGDEPPLVAAFTSTGRGEAIIFSHDRGRTFHEFSGNPVVKHTGRDPRLLWHEPTRRWVMAVYTEAEGKQWIAFHSSPDLKHWTYLSRIEGYYECPDLFELPIDGDAGRTKWVLYAADGRYVLGDFDGREFRPQTQKQQLWHGAFYAAQTFSNAPDNRRVQIGWGRGITFPGMPFNQQMTIPVELTLRTVEGNVQMFAEPVRELESLRQREHAWKQLVVEDGKQTMEEISADLLDISVELAPETAGRAGVIVRGIPVIYDAGKKELACRDVAVPLAPEEGVVRLRILADRGSLEIFGNDGRAAISVAAIPAEEDRSLQLSAEGGAATFRALAVHELRSAWRDVEGN
jgi:fructan beta-fructosidase